MESLSCLVSLVVCASIFFGGWTGLKSQCLYWDDFATYVEAWGPLFQKGIVSPLDTNVPANVASLVVDDFIRLLFIATSIAIFYTLLADAALMLGFIQYDGKLPPRSLLIGAIVVVLFTAPMVRWLNLSDFGVQMIRTRSFVLSVMLGAIPCLFVKKSDRAVSATLGAIWGVVSGTIWAAPGSILCVSLQKLSIIRLTRDSWNHRLCCYRDLVDFESVFFRSLKGTVKARRRIAPGYILLGKRAFVRWSSRWVVRLFLKRRSSRTGTSSVTTRFPDP